MKARSSGLVAISLLVLSSVSWSAEIDLYRGTVPMSDRSPEARSDAMRAALDQVLVRVSGRRQAPAIVDTRSDQMDIERYVQRSQYVRMYRHTGLESLSATAPKEPQLHLSVVFANDFVEGLLTGANLPLWDRNRSETLLWLVIAAENGYEMVVDEDNPAHEMIKYASEVRGLPFMLPLMDLDDQINFAPEVAWQADRTTFAAASARYGAPAALLGRLEMPYPGMFQVRWMLQKDNRVTEWSSRGTDLNVVLATGVDRSADELGRDYAVFVSTDNEGELVLTVGGVTSLRAYDRLVDFVSELTVVTSAQPVELQGDRVMLNLSLRGGRRSLIQLLDASRIVERDERAIGSGALLYQMRP